MQNILDVLRFTDIYDVVMPKLNLCHVNRPKGRGNIAMVYKPFGKTIYHCKGRDIVSDANAVILMPANVPYSFDCLETGYAYRLELETVGKLDDFYSFSCDKTIIDNFKNIYDMSKIISNDKFSMLSEFYKIISHLFKKRQSGDKSQHRIYKYAVKFIQDNYYKQIKFDSCIAEKIKISPVYLRKCFYEFADMPIKQFIIEYRINISKRLLSSGVSEKSIYKDIGYSSVNAFSREFKKKTGMTPREFKKTII